MSPPVRRALSVRTKSVDALKYDGLGHRVQKVFTQSSNTTVTNYFYNGDSAVSDVDQNGNVLARYAATQSIDEPLNELRSATTSYYSQDGLGSVTSVTTSARALGNTYRYDSFGNVTASSGSVANRFEYTGREFDPETGLYFYRARLYDVVSGRFLNEDPLELQDDYNKYAYVANNPTDFSDPLGLFKINYNIRLTKALNIEFACPPITAEGAPRSSRLYWNAIVIAMERRGGQPLRLMYQDSCTSITESGPTNREGQ